MKLNKFIKANKIPLVIATVAVLVGAGGGAYYLVKKQDTKPAETPQTNSETTTDAQVQKNVESKTEVAPGATTTTPAVTAEKPVLAALADVSLTVLRDTDMVQAYVSFYGPVGNYSVEKLKDGTWTTIVDQFSYSGSGGRYIDTIISADAETHYRVFRTENGVRTATSGDTVITWQQILSNGAFSVPLAR